MKFHNPTKNLQRFEIGKRAYTVPAGAEVDIPDGLAYVVRSRGMALEPGPAPAVEGQPVVEAVVVEAIPDSVEMLLTSKFIFAEEREAIRAAYRQSRGEDRVALVQRLTLRAQGRGTGEDPDEGEPEHSAVDVTGAADDEGAGDADASDVTAQINAAAAGVRARRSRG